MASPRISRTALFHERSKIEFQYILFPEGRQEGEIIWWEAGGWHPQMGTDYKGFAQKRPLAVGYWPLAVLTTTDIHR
jgi:hypothetical protein